MNCEEHKEYIEWLETNPAIPAGKTSKEVWDQKKRGDLSIWLNQ